VVTDGEEEDFLAGECLKFGISIDLAQLAHRAALMIATATQAANPVHRQSHPGRSPQQLWRSFLEALFPLHFSVQIFSPIFSPKPMARTPPFTSAQIEALLARHE
jgi:hypothetical protein